GSGSPNTDTIVQLINKGAGTLDVTNGARLTVDGRDNPHLASFNSGVIKATSHGKIFFEHAEVDNNSGGRLGALGRWSLILFNGALLENDGTVEAKCGGKVIFTDHDSSGNGSVVNNNATGCIVADGHHSLVVFTKTNVDNAGFIEARHGGKVVL